VEEDSFGKRNNTKKVKKQGKQIFRKLLSLLGTAHW
jgi:hypothetical protein